MQTTHLNLDSLPTYREGTVSHAWEQYWNSAGLCWFCTKVFQPQEQIQTNQELLACHRLHQRWVGQSKVSIQFAAFQLQHAQQVQFQVVFIIPNIILWGSYPLAESIYHFVGFPRVDIPNATSLATFLTYLQLSWGTHATPARASDENRLHHDLYNDSTRYSRYSYKELL